MIRNVFGVRNASLRDYMGWADVSLHFARDGEPTPPVVVVVGGNGSGKTGLLRGIARSLRLRGAVDAFPYEGHCGAEARVGSGTDLPATARPGIFVGRRTGVELGADVCDDDTIATVRRAIADVMGPDWDITSTPLRSSGVWAYSRLGDGPRRLYGVVGDVVEYFERHGGFESHGVVVIDDIDERLDAHAQYRVVPLLRRLFPRVQFILSSRSPFVAASVGPADGLVLRIVKPAEGPVAECVKRDPRLLSATELMRDFLQMDDIYPTPEGRALREYVYLAANPYRSDSDQAEMERLRRELAAAGVDHGYKPVKRTAAKGGR